MQVWSNQNIHQVKEKAASNGGFITLNTYIKMKEMFLRLALNALGYVPPQMPEIGSGDATGLVLQNIMPYSYPAIMQQVYAEGSASTPSNSQITFNVPSDVNRLLGFATYSATATDQEAAFCAGVTCTININQDIVVKQSPLLFFVPGRNPNNNLPFVTIGRKVKVGDNVTVQMTTASAATNVIWVAVYQKGSRSLI